MKYFVACSILSVVTAVGQVDITTWQVNLQHTGANLNETFLNPGNVGSPGNFGLLFTQSLDGQSYGQPLYVSSATLGKFADGSTHNVVYVATEHDSVYAFDADNNITAQTSGPLWYVSLLQPGQTTVPQSVVGSGDIPVELGITATPVIDTVGSTLYVVSKVQNTSDGSYQQYLYALDLKTGATKLGTPILVNPTFAGSANDGANGVVPFSGLHEHGRSALAFYNGVLYVAYASHSDTQPYHGEVLGYDTNNSLQLIKSFITTPNGNEAGIWGAGASPAIDTQGNMFVSTGNGDYDQRTSPYTTGTNWGQSILKLPTNTTGPITVPYSNTLNWFTPNIWNTLNQGNLDLGSGGLLLLPDQTGGNHTHIMVGGGKGAVLYVVDRDNLGGLNTPDNAIQEIPEAGGNWLFVTPAYFNGNIYYSASGGLLEQRAVGYDPTTGDYISTAPITSTKNYNNKGSGVFISANGSNNGIVWILNGSGLDAYNATSVAAPPIYTAQSTIPTGNIGTQNTKFSLPLVVNGKVYYTAVNWTTNTGYLLVSGLFGAAGGTPAAPSDLQGSGASSSSTIVTWTDNSNNESGFIIRRASAASGPFTQVATVGANITQYIDTGLTPLTTYFYQVLATNNNGNSPATNVASATTFPLFTSAGLVAYWNLDSLGANNSVADVTGNGNNGTANGEAMFLASGFINGAFAFHGTPVVSNISVPNTPSMQFSASQSFTVSAWVNPANLNGVQQPVISKSGDQGNPYGIYINANSNWVFHGLSDIVGPTAIQGVWTNVAVVQDGVAGTRSLYINGSLVATGAAQAADGAGYFVMGQATASGGTFGFQGVIDEVRLYNIALPAGGITDLLGPPVLEALSLQSQGAAGVMSLVLSPSTVSVIEPRQGAVTGSYSVACHFDAAVSPGITATLGLQNGGNAGGTVTSVTYDPTMTVVTVGLTGVTDRQALNIHLAGIMPGNGTADIPLNILWGDVNGDAVVNNLDLTIVQQSYTQAVSQSTALYDINGDGLVNSADAAIITALIGTNLGPQTDTNLALFQPATASSVNNTNVAANAFDNNINTRWESVQGPAADPSWLEVDLGQPATIHEMVVNWETAAGADYQLQVSSDNQNWTTVVNVTGNTSGGIFTFPNLNAVGRWVRMYGTQRTTGYGYSIWEFQVIGIPVSNNNVGGTAPPAPLGVMASPGTGQVSLSWMASTGATSYSVFRGTASGGETLLTSGLTASPYVDSAVTDGTKYFYYVEAVNSTGSSTPSSEVSTTPTAAAGIPATPLGLTAMGGNAQVALQWNTSTGATSYNVYRGTAAGAESTTPLATNVTVATYTDTSVSSGVTYFYKVAGVNTAGVSGLSSEASAASAPAAPLGLTAMGGSGQVALQWNTSTGATSYNVYRGTATGAESTTPLATNVTVATYTDTSVTTGVTYFYKVAAVNTAGVSGLSSEAFAAPLTQQTGTVAIYQIDSGSTSGFAPFSADEFYNTGATAAVGTTITTAGISNAAPMQVYQANRYGVFTYTIPGLTAGASYTVRLHFAETYWQAAGKRVFNVAINGAGVLSNFDIFATAGGPNIAVVETFTATANSSGNIVVSFTTGSADQPQVNGIEILSSGGPIPLPAAPVGLTANAGNQQVLLSWNAGNGPSGTYSVWRSNISGGEGGTPIRSGLTGTQFIDSTVSNLASYYYEVTATNGAGTSSFSNEASATPGAPVTGTPVYQVDAGGGAVAPFAADEFFTGGGEAATGNAINTSAVVSPAPAAVYQSERSGGSFTYTFPNLTPGASYLIRLHFAEFYWNAAGQRVFNVAINNTPVLQNFDIIAVAGAKNTALIEQFIATADANGHVTVTYTVGSADQPKASGIEVLSNSGSVPAAPSGVMASPGTGQVSLTWMGSTGATSYSVFRGTASGGETLLTSGLTASPYVDSAVTGGTKYFYYVEAVNSTGSSTPSSEVSTTPTAGVVIPSAPLGLTAMGGNGQVALQWNTSTGATSYNVYRGATAGAESTTPLATNVTVATYTDTSVTSGVTYFYKVAAVNTAGVSGLSSEVSAAPVPAAPLGLTAMGGNAQIALQWNTSTGATSYNVYRGTATGAESTTPLATNVTVATYTDTSVTSGFTYFYKVAAVNTAGVSGLSGEASAAPVPAAPLSLTAMGGSGQVALQWNTSTGATSYNVYRGTATGAESTTPLATNITVATYTDTSVSSGVTYFYKVAAVNTAGVSGLSGEASAAPAPAAPLGLTAMGGNAQVALQWNTSTGATSYSVYRGTATGAESTTPLATNVTGATYTDTSVSSGVTYFYKVAAVNTAGVSGLSSEASAAPVPAVPLGLTAMGGSGQVALQWNTSTGATSYNVYRGTAAGAESTTPLATNVTVATYTDTSVSSGVTYFYKVAAVNTAGVSGLSGEAFAAPTAAPAAPLGLTAMGGNAQVALQWSSSTGATSYNVYRGTTAGAESTTPLATNVTVATYTDTSVTSGVTYFYKVAAVNTAGVSGLSGEASAASVPAAPLGLTAMGGSGQVALQWNTSTGATSYNVYRGTATGGESTTPVATNVTVATYTDTSVASGVTYFYKVAAVNTAGVSGLSGEASAAPVPAAPLGLTAMGGSGQVALQWNTSTGATSYNVYRGTATGGESTTPLATNVTVATYADTSVASGVTYFYKVAALNTAGVSGLSSEASAAPVPAVPLGLTAMGGNAQVALQWNTSTGATSYNVYRGTATGAESTTPLATNVTVATYTDTSVSSGVTYFYKVAGVNTAGVSGLSGEAFAAPTAAPAAPLGLTAMGGNAQVALQWSSSTGATSYNVYRGTTTGAESTTPLATNVTVATYTDTSVSSGVTYFYKVAAVNTAGVSGLSSEASAAPAPAVPLGLTAMGGNAQIALQWNTSTGATSYNVYRGATAGAESTTPLATNVTVATYTDTSVTSGVTYFYKVAAVNTAGVSGLSSEASAAPVPAAPLGLTAMGGSGQVALQWNTSTGATSYNVYRATATGGESTTPLATNVTVATYTDSSVSSGVTYFYKVAAVNSAGVSGLSTEASAAPVPAAPLGLTAMGGNAQVALQWNTSTGATSYNVYRGTTAGAESTTPLATNVTVATYTDTSVSSGVTYFYKVAGVNTAGVSGLSSEASAAPVPAAPLGLTAMGGSGQIALQWNTSTGATSYNVYRGTTTGAESTTPLATNVTVATYTDTSVTSGVTYFYKVAAVNTAGVSGLSGEAFAAPLTQQTGTVAIYQIDSGSTSGFAPFSADEFYNTGATAAVGTTIATAGISNAAPMQVYQANRYGVFTYTIPGLTAGASYTVRLHFAETYWQAAGKRVFNVAINGTGVLSNFDIFATAGGPNIAVVETFTATANSSGDIVITFTTGSADQPQVNAIEILSSGGPIPVPVAPVGLTATAGNRQVMLSWQAGNGPSGTYSVWRSNTSGGEGGTPLGSGLTGTHFIDSTVSNLATYYYKVTATNTAGTSSYSNEASATPGAPVTGTVVYQVNTGGGAVAPFAADEFFTGGGEAATGNAINTSAVVSPAPAAVYQSERSGGSFTYTFPNLTPGASYLIRLHFAEFYWTAAGKRVFNVAINNTPVLQNFDIIAVAGAANTALVEQFIAAANANGVVTVTYTSGSADQPKASAIEVYQQ